MPTHHDTPEPSAAHMQAAWDLLHRPGWLPLADIALQAQRHSLLRGAAQRLARGEGVSRTEACTTAAANDITAPNPRPVGPPNRIEHLGWPWPPRRAGGYTHGELDRKRAAAGDRDD